MKNIILGGNGQLGSYIFEKLKGNAAKISSNECDITKPKEIQRIFKFYKPKYVFNCAAYHNTHECELNPHLSFLINSTSLKYISDNCNIHNSKLIHFSSDYVFNGRTSKKYTENAKTDPINIYGISKLAGEQIVKYYSKKYLIIRISSVYSQKTCRAKKDGNFVDKIIFNSKKRNISVSNQKITPSNCEEIADQVIHIYKKINKKLIHISPPDSTTWYQFARHINRVLGLNAKIIKKIEKVELLNRPNNSALKPEFLIKNRLFVMSKWKQAFKKYAS